jgi:hypothetical protein
MATRVHRPLKIIFNANGIWRWQYALSKQLQDLHIDAALLSETHLKLHESFFIPNFHFYRTDRFPGRKGIPHNHVDLCYMYTWQRQSLFIRDKLILSSEMLHKDYDHKCSVEKKSQSSGRPQGTWPEDVLIGSKPLVIKQLNLTWVSCKLQLWEVKSW